MPKREKKKWEKENTVLKKNLSREINKRAKGAQLKPSVSIHNHLSSTFFLLYLSVSKSIKKNNVNCTFILFYEYI